MSYPPWTSHRVPESPCPRCGHRLSGAGEAGGTPPEPGDVNVCIRCATILRFTQGLGLRLVTPAELDAIRFEDPAWWECIQQLRARILNLPSRN